MTFKQAKKIIENGGCVFAIGQLDNGTTAELNRESKLGTIAKIKTLWPWHTMGIKKTAYCLPELAFHFSMPTQP